MGILKSGKKAAKFTFVSMPLSILGINHLKLGNQVIAQLWKSLSNPICPECDKGVLVMQANTEDEEVVAQEDNTTHQLYPWICKNCGAAFLEENNVAIVREKTQRYRNERVKADLSDMEYAERLRIARGHCLHSRAFFCASALAAAGFIYMLASGASFLLALNWLSISFALSVFGIKKSFRAWQIRTGHLFIKGGFLFWLKHEKWLA